MKKIFTFLIALFSISSLFAQSHSWNSNDRHQSSGSSSYGQSTYDNRNTGSYDAHNYGQQPAYNSHNNDSWNNERNTGNYHDNGNSSWNNDRNSGNYHDNGNDRWNNDRNSGYYRNNDRHDAYGHHSNDYDVRRNAPVYYHRNDSYYGREPQRTGSTIKAVGAGLIVGGIIALMAGSH